jgi:Rieske Fe-S protein
MLLLGFGRKAWAQLAAASAIRYAPLTRPIRIPLGAVEVPWRPVSFTAEAMTPATAVAPSRRVLISGIVFRRQMRTGGSDLCALCLTCPHEQCQVDLITDPEQLVKMTGTLDHHPMFECGCHMSVFDAMEDGARVTGETPRGLYRFRIGDVTDGTVEISEVEADALTAV